MDTYPSLSFIARRAESRSVPPPPHTHCVGGRYPSVGSRKWGGNGRGLEEGYALDPPNIPPYPPPHNVCGGRGTLRDSALRSYSFLFTMKLKDGYVSIFKFHSKQKKSRVA